MQLVQLNPRGPSSTEIICLHCVGLSRVSHVMRVTANFHVTPPKELHNAVHSNVTQPINLV